MQYKVLNINIYLTYKSTAKMNTFLVYLQQNQYFMAISPSKFNRFLFFKLPSAFWCGVRVKSISDIQCVTSVKHKWFNQNPFNSMYFAVQAMAAELSTGALIVTQIENSGANVSMLVATSTASYSKKARGRITFTCNNGSQSEEAIQKTIATGEGQTVWMQSIGIDEKGDQVSVFDFQWTVRVK